MEKLIKFAVFSILYCAFLLANLSSMCGHKVPDHRPITANLSIDSDRQLKCNIRNWVSWAGRFYIVSFSFNNITFGYYSPEKSNPLDGKMIWNDLSSEKLQGFYAEGITDNGLNSFSVFIKPDSNFYGDYQCDVRLFDIPNWFEVEFESATPETPKLFQQASSKMKLEKMNEINKQQETHAWWD